MIDKLVNSIKKHEGFRGNEYLDTRNIPTIGYGTKLPLEPDEAELLLKHRLYKLRSNLIGKWNNFLSLPILVKEVVLEMCYQLGVNGFLRFKKTIKYLENRDWIEASREMLDSKWYEQTPNRAIELSNRLKRIKDR